MKELWEAAVAVRGMIEPADYKRYVLPVIFLRFLSLHYEKRRAELTAYVREAPAGYDVGIENLESIVNDPDEYRAGGAFMIPETPGGTTSLRMHSEATSRPISTMSCSFSKTRTPTSFEPYFRESTPAPI